MDLTNSFLKVLKGERASVGLTTVLIITAILLSGGITIALINVDMAFASKNFASRNVAELIGVTCFEESMREFKSSTAFVGEVNYSNTVGSCLATVSNDPVDPNVKLVEIESTVGEYVYSYLKEVDISTEPFSVLE